MCPDRLSTLAFLILLEIESLREELHTPAQMMCDEGVFCGFGKIPI